MRKLVFIIIVVASFQACQSTQTLQLSPFSKRIIDLYDKTYHVQSQGDQEMVYMTYADSSYYRIFCYSQDTHKIPLKGSDYLGQTTYHGITIHLFGVQESLFFKGPKVSPSIIESQERRDEIIIFDPITWEIVLKKKNLRLSEPYTNGMDSITYEEIEKIVTLLH